MQLTKLDEVLPASAGFIRFCSAFMAGPAEGFSNYTLFLNEESNDVIDVPAGATYGSDPSVAPYRQAGYSVALDTAGGGFHPIPINGRHNHENTVVVPGGWDDTVALSGDDTFTAPGSQVYMTTAASPSAFVGDDGDLWAFRVTAKNGSSVNAARRRQRRERLPGHQCRRHHGGRVHPRAGRHRTRDDRRPAAGRARELVKRQ